MKDINELELKIIKLQETLDRTNTAIGHTNRIAIVGLSCVVLLTVAWFITL